MKYDIHSDKLLVTDAIREYINEKLNKLNKYFKNLNNITARIFIKVKGINQTIEVTILTNHYILRNEETNVDLYAAIDLVVDKLERQIIKNKTRLQAKMMKKRNNEFYFNDKIETEEDNKEEKVVRRKNIEMKPMDEEEAILEMNMLGHDFFIYKDAETNHICVIYKRKDGHYGIIETK